MLNPCRSSALALAAAVAFLSPIGLGSAYGSGPIAIVVVENNSSTTRTFLSGECYLRNPITPGSPTLAPSASDPLTCVSTSSPILVGEVRYNNCTLGFNRLDPMFPALLSAGPDCAVAVVSENPNIVVLTLTLTD